MIYPIDPMYSDIHNYGFSSFNVAYTVAEEYQRICNTPGSHKEKCPF